MKLKLIALAGLLWLVATECLALGRLFYSPAQRALLDRPPVNIREPEKTAARHSSRVYTSRLDGIVRGQGQAWIWFDGELKKSGSPPLTPIPVDETQITLHWHGRRLILKPGQKLTADENGRITIQEAFGR